jgi:hypothetical protein
VPAKGYSYNGVVKLDYNINDKHRLFFHWFGGQGNQIAPVGLSAALATASSIDPFYYEVAPIHVYNYSLVLNSTFSSRFTNQVLVGANYFNQVFTDNHNNIQPGALGLKVSPDLHLLGASELQIHGFDGVGITNPNGRNDITYHITDNASYTQGAHQMRFGAEIRFANVNEFYHRRGRGRFTFDGSQGPWSSCATAACTALSTSGLLGKALALADFMAGDVVSSRFALGNPERTVRVNAVNAHFQDSWQVTRNLNLNLGLRWEYFGPLHNGEKDLAFFDPVKGFQIQGVDISSIFPPDRRAFAPRFGFAYHANNFGGWVVRGNVGVYYDQINMNPFLDNHVGSDGVEGNPFGPKPYPLFTTSILGQTNYNWDQTMAASPTGYLFPGIQATATTVGALCQNRFCTTPPSATYAGDPQNLGVFSVNQNFRTPYYLNYSLQVEKALGNKVIWQIGYVGSEARKLSIFGDINQNGAFPQFNSVIQLSSTGTSNYNSLQTQLRTNYWHNLSGAIGYTWAHALDEVSEYRGVTLDNAFDKHFDYGNSDFDTRHLFTISMVYDVPKASWATGPWANRLWNGWQFSTFTNFHTGQPSDDGRLGLDLIADPYKGANHSFVKGVGEQWWNGNAFAEPLPGTPGNLSRNKLYGPGFASVDVSVIKNVPITERLKVQLRADMFNILNRKNLASIFGGVSSSCGNIPTVVNGVARLLCGNSPGGFGWVQDTISDSQAAPGIGPGEPFQIQLVAKIIF